VSAALETIDGDRITANGLCLQRVAYGGTFVDHLDAVLFQDRQDLHRIVPGGLNNFHTAFDDGFHIAWIVRRVDDRQERKVHADRLVSHVTTARDLICEVCRGFLRQGRNDAETASIRHGGSHFGKPDIVHAALDDRMLDSEHFCDGSLHGISSLFPAYPWRKDGAETRLTLGKECRPALADGRPGLVRFAPALLTVATLTGATPAGFGTRGASIAAIP